MEEVPACREQLSEPRRRTSSPQHVSPTTNRYNVVQVTIDTVPDVALIEIFDFYMAEALHYDPFRHNSEAWIILAHVCQKWRDIVFGSPCRLNVRLFFHARRSVRVMLDTWPPLPIDIWGCDGDLGLWGMNNIVAALEHNDRIQNIELGGQTYYVEEALAAMQTSAAMQKSFPCLTELAIKTYDETAALVIPNLFSSGSAPLLQSLRLRSFHFPLPLLQDLLLSANLVEIRIWKIPDSGFVSPEALVACLSALTKLETFELGFQYSLPWTSRGPPPSTSCALPALTSLRFKGPLEYLEHLIAPIDSPLLDNLDVILFYRPSLNTPQLAQFVDRTPKLKALCKAHIFFDRSDVFISLPWTRRRGLHFRVPHIPHILSDQFSVMVQLCASSFLRTLIPMMKQLYIIDSGTSYLNWLDGVESSRWLDLLRPFTTVEDLYLSRDFSPVIVPALRGIILTGMAEVLPSLQNVFLEGPSQPGSIEEQGIEQFVATLHHSSRPITVSRWHRDKVRDSWWRHEDR